MTSLFVRFPGFKRKAVTFSYDDGVRQDKRLIEIMKQNGLKGTFNLNGGRFAECYEGVEEGRMTVAEAEALYLPSGMEVAVHGYRHASLARIDRAAATDDVLSDRKALEQIFGCVIKGMAYANGSYNDEVVEILKCTGISYARTTTATGRFDLPTDWLRLPTTCHHNDPRLMELAREFAERGESAYTWGNSPMLFSVWGHSYEFDRNDNWGVIEELAAYIGNREDIYYATNGELFSYLQAADRLEFGAEGKLVYNPSATDVYLKFYGKEVIALAGKTVSL